MHRRAPKVVSWLVNWGVLSAKLSKGVAVDLRLVPLDVSLLLVSPPVVSPLVAPLLLVVPLRDGRAWRARGRGRAKDSHPR